MFRIGEFSKMGKTTVKTLRYYDETGLLRPEATDALTGYRLYTTGQLFRLHAIQALRQCGLSIGEIRRVQAGQDLRAVLEDRRAEVQRELERAQQQLAGLEFMLQGKQEEVFMSYAATIKELPACIVYSKRITLPDYSAYFQQIPAIGAQVSAQYPDLKCTVPEYCFSVYLDGEYRERDINVEFCERVERRMPDFADIRFKELEAATAVSVLHKGPYTGLGQAYAYLFQWIEQNGYVPIQPPRESYIDGVWNKDSEEDWLTELQVPVDKK